MAATRIASAVSSWCAVEESRGKADGEKPSLSLWPVLMVPEHPADASSPPGALGVAAVELLAFTLQILRAPAH